MTNIEKFQKLKELCELRCELHKQKIIDIVQLKQETEEKVDQFRDILSYVNMGVQVYKDIDRKMKSSQ